MLVAWADCSLPGRGRRPFGGSHGQTSENRRAHIYPCQGIGHCAGGVRSASSGLLFGILFLGLQWAAADPIDHGLQSNTNLRSLRNEAQDSKVSVGSHHRLACLGRQFLALLRGHGQAGRFARQTAISAPLPVGFGGIYLGNVFWPPCRPGQRLPARKSFSGYSSRRYSAVVYCRCRFFFFFWMVWLGGFKLDFQMKRAKALRACFDAPGNAERESTRAYKISGYTFHLVGPGGPSPGGFSKKG